MRDFDTMQQLLMSGKAKELKALVTDELEAGTQAQEILNKSLIPAMSVVGEKFKKNEVFVPEVLVAARAMNWALDVLRPALAQAGVKPLGTAVICTVKGDLHDIGKNLVKIMLEGIGIHVIDLGVDCPPEKVVQAISDNSVQLVCLSSLLTTTMSGQKDTIDAICASGLRDRVKVMVGGAPVSQEFADMIGADAYTKDAATAAQVAKTLLTPSV